MERDIRRKMLQFQLGNQMKKTMWFAQRGRQSGVSIKILDLSTPIRISVVFDMISWRWVAVANEPANTPTIWRWKFITNLPRHLCSLTVKCKSNLHRWKKEVPAVSDLDLRLSAIWVPAGTFSIDRRRNGKQLGNMPPNQNTLLSPCCVRTHRSKSQLLPEFWWWSTIPGSWKCIDGTTVGVRLTGKTVRVLKHSQQQFH